MNPIDTEALKALVAKWRKSSAECNALMAGENSDPERMAALHSKAVHCALHADALQAALERMLASQTQGEESVNPADIPTLAEMRELFSSAPVASQMGEPVAWMCKPVSGPEFVFTTDPVVAKLWGDAIERDVIPLYAAPAAGMDADSSPPLAEPDK